MLVYSGFGYKNKVAAGGWFMTMNFGVHAVMYTYYTLKAAKVKSPRWFPILVTSLQILQMFIGATVGIWLISGDRKRDATPQRNSFFWSFILCNLFCSLCQVLPPKLHNSQDQSQDQEPVSGWRKRRSLKPSLLPRGLRAELRFEGMIRKYFLYGFPMGCILQGGRR